MREFRQDDPTLDSRTDADDLMDEDVAAAKSLARLDQAWKRGASGDDHVPTGEQQDTAHADGDELDEDAAAQRSIARLDGAWRNAPEIVTERDRSYVRARRAR